VSGKLTAGLAGAINSVAIANASGTDVTFLQTFYEATQEVVVVNTWTTTPNYDSSKGGLLRIASSLIGLSPNASPAGGGQPNETDVAKRLSALKALLDKGLITQADYETKKGEVLKSL
jgi:hypothetical protein